MLFELKYDVILTPALHIGMLAFGLVFSLPGLGSLFMWKRACVTVRVFIGLFFCLSVVLLSALAMSYVQHGKLVAAAKSGDVKVITGVIQDVVDTRTEHHFTVNGTRFEGTAGKLWINDYPTDIEWAHISRTVRIHYVDGSLITKFEISTK